MGKYVAVIATVLLLFSGSEFVAAVENCCELYSSGNNFQCGPHDNNSQRYGNCTWYARYIPFLWPEVVVVNEVYPEPSEKEVADIKAKGAVCYHIVGAKGRAWPGFPRGYAGGIPCCASFWPENGKGYEVILKKM